MRTAEHRRRYSRRLRGPESLEARRVLDAVGLALIDASLPPREDDPESPGGEISILEEGPAGSDSENQPGDSGTPPPLPPYDPVGSEEALRTLLLDAGLRNYQDWFGEPAWQPWFRWLHTLDLRLDAIPHLTPAVSYSQTHVQVAGVDEADIVETDGQYLYVLGQGRLQIIDIQSPGELSIAATVELPRGASAMYLAGDRLAVLSQTAGSVFFAEPLVEPRFADQLAWWPQGDPRVHLTLLDVRDPASPQLVQKMELEGNLVESRAVDGSLRLVLSHHDLLPEPVTVCESGGEVKQLEPHGSSTPLDPASGVHVLPAIARVDRLWEGFPETDCRWESEAAYRERVAALPLVDLFPSYTVEGLGDQPSRTGLLTAPEQVWAAAEGRYDAALSVVLVDMDQTSISGPSSSVTLLDGAAGQVYATSESIYVLSSQWHEQQEYTQIQQFGFAGDGSVTRVAAGVIPGRVLNQFSVDEFSGYLRIAVSSGWGENATSGVYILQADGEQLTTIGSLEGLAPGEAIFAVRFLGEQAYVVTFRRIDPLFALDLSNPAEPIVAGELKIPGFSNFLQPIGGTHLLGLGRHADESNGFALEPQLSLFDVSELSRPELIDKYLVEAHGQGWSLAFHDHHAVGYFADAQLLAIPFQSVTFDDATHSRLRSDADSIPQPRIRNELWLFRIDPAAGEEAIQQLGVISHDSPALRSVKVGETLYSIASDEVRAYDLSDLSQPLDVLYTGEVARDDHFRVRPHETETRLDVLVNDPGASAAGLKIVHVSAPAAGGQVKISEDGQYLIYIPPSDEGVDHDRFEYTVEAESGRQDRAAVSLEIVREATRERMVRLAKSDLADQLDVPVEEIRVVSATRQQWPDSCLGLGGPEEACLTVITPGFEVVLAHARVRYIYRTDSHELVKLARKVEHEEEAGPVHDRYELPAGSGEHRLDVLANDFPGIVFIRQPLITGVTAPRLGRVQITDGGYALLYTPPADRTGEDLFEYTLDSGQSAKVVIRVTSPVDLPDVVHVRLEATNDEGQPVVALSAGEEFTVRVLVSESMPDADGVFAAYLNLRYNAGLAEVVAPPEFGDEFPNGHTGKIDQRGLVANLGAFNDIDPPAEAESLLATIRFRALASGPLVIMAAPPTDSVEFETLVFGRDDAVARSAIGYGDLELQVMSTWQNEAEPRDVNGDGEVTPFDALDLIDDINLHGARRLTHQAVRAIAGDATGRIGRELRFRDPNGDGYCAPDDVIRIINYLNELSPRALQNLPITPPGGFESASDPPSSEDAMEQVAARDHGPAAPGQVVRRNRTERAGRADPPGSRASSDSEASESNSTPSNTTGVVPSVRPASASDELIEELAAQIRRARPRETGVDLALRQLGLL